MKRRTAFYLFAGLLLLGLVYLVSDYGIGLSGSLRPIEAGAAFKLDYGIPAVVHQTWKASISPPSELVRWRDGCTRLNKGFSFQMYSDEDLYAFTKKHYQRYLGMFEALHGVCK